MRRLMVVLAGLAWGGGAAAQGQPAPPQRPAFWPPEGRIGIAAMVKSRGGGCRLSLLALNNTTQDYRDIRVTLVITAQGGLGQVTDSTFRMLDAGGAREAPAWISERCERNPRIEIREAVCTTGPLNFRDCLAVVQPFTPPPQRERELARITIVAPR